MKFIQRLSLLTAVAIGLIASPGAFAQSSAKPKQSGTPAPGVTQYVDPFIGTGFHGHVFLGANVPFGAVQLGPTLLGPMGLADGWDWCSGYHNTDSLLIGFSHTHLSGTGIGDLGDVLIMPTTGPVHLTKGKPRDSQSGYASHFVHSDETARPGYYAVKLPRYNVGAELTATERVGMHRYTFPKTSDAHILIDLEQGIGWDKSTETKLEKLNDSTLVGYRFSKGWAADQRLFFAIVLSRPVASFALYDDQTAATGQSLTSAKTKGVLSFATKAGETVQLKVGISPVSADNALANIRAEIPGWNFNQVRADADAVWNRELGKVQVKSADRSRLTTFYTALYHTMIAPSIFNDHNGDYRGTDKKVYSKAPFTNLTTFSLWDTYRAANPLYTLVQPQRVGDMVNSMLAIGEQQGSLPIWPLMGNETNTMPGNSSLPIISDAILKRIPGIDANRAYTAMKASAMRDPRGLKWARNLQFIPADSMVESVAQGLEYAIDDWAVAQVAKKLGKTDDYAYFSKRAKAYQHYFDPATKFMRGRVSETAWRTPFSPVVSRHMKDDFAEGNAWQYTWLVPQDVEGLMALMGGEQAFTKKLDSLFVVKSDMGAEASNDITGLIGQYAHGNEPSHHITYLYAYAGQPWKTADKVRYIMDSLYSARPDGLCGNEDVGQMSAWYVLSAMGFYPVNPANGAYVFGSPLFDAVTLSLPGNKSFSINVRNNSTKNRYIKAMTLNGKPYARSYIHHQDLLNGGTLVIDMSDKPSTTWGTAPTDRPRSVY
ncbi:GH92 family glycosyl hydrolase [Spirosoma rhododendri]|uniref:Glycoside hydrolase family 92 protein n=1 Tax=Spirosoma rhododendri TaxID=2728024 RepID=A0A7L5DIE3_9BACT|nr:GH92 family glycosyl hydrolase [Spirosoma rhododendri]QJD77141.1 glycoside hydrolase family 92 protein [Spirosoma rhododendri]